jgi:hypothetical protein
MQIFSGNGAAAMAAVNVAKISGMVGMAAAVTSMFKPQWSQVGHMQQLLQLQAHQQQLLLGRNSSQAAAMHDQRVLMDLL